MKITVSTAASCQATLTLEVEKERVAPYLERGAKRISQQADVPGYRRGKAPYHMVERAFGPGAIYEEALQELGPELVEEALKEKELTPLTQPRLTMREMEPLTLELEVVLPPKAELGDYTSIRVEPEKVEVKEEDVAAALKEIQEAHGEWVSADRAVQYGDQLVLDMAAHADEKALFELKETTFIPREGLSVPIPGFSEKLIGLEPSGEELTFSLSFPDDYDDKELAGKEVECRVSIYDVQERHLPELDDNLAKLVGDYASLEDLRDKLRQGLQEQRDAQAQEKAADEALRQVVEISKIEYPAVLVDAEVESMLQDQRQRLQRQGFTLEGYLQMLQKTETAYRQELRPQAEQRLARSLALGKVAEAEKVEVTEEELQTEIESFVLLYGREHSDALRQGLSSQQAQEEMRSRVLTRKTIARLMELAQGKPPQEEAKPAEAADSSEKAPEES